MAYINDTANNNTETIETHKGRGNSVGYRLRLRNGRWNWEIRRDKFKDGGPYSGTFELGTSQDEARKMVQEFLRDLETADFDTIENKTLKGSIES